MTLQRKAPLLVILVALLTATIAAWSAYNSNAQLLDAYKQRDMQTVVSIMHNSLDEQTKNAAASASLVAALPTVQRLFRARDQQKLVDELKPAFQIQQEQFNVEDGQFFLPPAVEFLRLNKPTNFMEDVSGFREMVLTANRSQEGQRGLEISQRYLTIRGLSIVQDAQGPIGMFEVQLNFDAVLREAKKIADSDAALFVSEQLMTKIAYLAPKPEADQVIGGYRRLAATNWPVIQPLVTAELLTKAKEVTYKQQTVSGIPYGIVVIPLLDFKGSKIGYMVATRNFESYQHQLIQALVRAFALGGLQAILLIGAVLLVFNGMLMRPVASLDKMLAQLAAGDCHVDTGDLSQRPDEVGSMARSITILRNDLVAYRGEQKGKNSC